MFSRVEGLWVLYWKWEKKKEERERGEEMGHGLAGCTGIIGEVGWSKISRCKNRFIWLNIARYKQHFNLKYRKAQACQSSKSPSH